MQRHARILLLNSSLLLFYFFGKGQYYFYNERYYDPLIPWEIGFSVGSMNCLTDLGGNTGPGRFLIKDINIKNSRLCASVYLHALYNYIIGGRIEFTVGQITAYDSVLKNDITVARYRYNRNLHFRSIISELSAIGEWYFLWQLIQHRKTSLPLLSPYLLAGISIFHFEPETRLDDHWVSLQPLHTEGQGFAEYPHRNNYKLTQLNIPLGIGIRYELSALFNLQLELVHRLLFTDYLDDVSTRYVDPMVFDRHLDVIHSSLAKELFDRGKELDPSLVARTGQQRGDPSKKDSFFSVNMKFGVVLNRKRR